MTSKEYYDSHPKKKAQKAADNSKGGKFDRPNGKDSYGATHIAVNREMDKRGISRKGKDVVKTNKKTGLKFKGNYWTTRARGKNRGVDRYA